SLTRRSVTCEPISPAPPVTSERFIRLRKSARGLRPRRARPEITECAAPNSRTRDHQVSLRKADATTRDHRHRNRLTRKRARDSNLQRVSWSDQRLVPCSNRFPQTI